MMTTTRRIKFSIDGGERRTVDGFIVRAALNGRMQRIGWHLFTPEDEWCNTFTTLDDVRDAITEIRAGR